MTSFPCFLLAAILVGAQANWQGHGCPFLKKVVPQGKSYYDLANDMLRLRCTDCVAFAEKFSENGNFAFADFTMKGSAEIKRVCQTMKNPPSAESELKTLQHIWPAFSTSDMLMETWQDGVRVRRSTGGYGNLAQLTQVHFCSKTGKVTTLKTLSNDKETPESLIDTADRFMKKILEEYDCSVYSDLVDSNAAVNLYGEPARLTRDQSTKFEGAALAKAACEEKARREKRIHTSNSLEIKNYYYDESMHKLTIIAERSVAVVFRPGVVRSHPIAVTLHFSPSGQIKAVDSYEIEVKHLEEKWGKSSYTAAPTEAPKAQSQAAAPIKENAVVKAAPAEVEKASPVDAEAAKGTPEKVAEEVHQAAEKVSVVKSASLVDAALSGVSAATGAMSSGWRQMLVVVLSVCIANL